MVYIAIDPQSHWLIVISRWANYWIQDSTTEIE